MDSVTRDKTVRDLKEQLERCRIQAASLDNDTTRRNEMTQTMDAIQLLLDFLQRKDGMR